MSVIVTGGAGFIGSCIVRTFLHTPAAFLKIHHD